SLSYSFRLLFSFFFFYDTSPSEIYTLSLHDALPISIKSGFCCLSKSLFGFKILDVGINDVEQDVFGIGIHFLYIVDTFHRFLVRSEEHTSELQSRENLVCRLLLEKKKKQNTVQTVYT